jgi:hypothetical protein
MQTSRSLCGYHDLQSPMSAGLVSWPRSCLRLYIKQKVASKSYCNLKATSATSSVDQRVPIFSYVDGPGLVAQGCGQKLERILKHGVP